MKQNNQNRSEQLSQTDRRYGVSCSALLSLVFKYVGASRMKNLLLGRSIAPHGGTAMLKKIHSNKSSDMMSNFGERHPEGSAGSFSRRLLGIVVEFKDFVLVLLEPVFSAFKIIQLLAKGLILRHKLRNLNRGLVKATARLNELLIEQRDLRSQQVDDVLAKSSRAGCANNFFSGRCETHFSEDNVKGLESATGGASSTKGLRL